MAWSPDPSLPLYNAGELFEFTEINHPITYVNETVDGLQEQYVVTSINASETNATLNVSTNGISGSYSGSFEGFSIQFLTPENKIKTVNRWESVVGADEIVSYRPSMQRNKTYTYTATAVDATTNQQISAVYTVVVTNSWDRGRTALLKAIAETIRKKK